MDLRVLPKWITLEWDVEDGTHRRQGFVTEYEHVELPHKEEFISHRPRIHYTPPRDVFRYVINGEEVTIGPYFSEIRTYIEEA